MKTCIVAVLLLLAVAGCSQAGASTTTTSAATAGRSAAPAASVAGGSVGPSAAAGTTQIHVRDFTLDPKDLAVTGTVSLAVTNDGPTIHNVSIRDASGKVVGATKDLTPGQSETLTVKIPGGSYTLFCSLPGHESLGIKGTLTVSQ